MPFSVRIVPAPPFGSIKRIQLQVADGYRDGERLPGYWPASDKEKAAAWARDIGFIVVDSERHVGGQAG